MRSKSWKFGFAAEIVQAQSADEFGLGFTPACLNGVGVLGQRVLSCHVPLCDKSD